MKWNYRVVKTGVSCGDPILEVFECYYENGTPPDGIPTSCIDGPMMPYGEGLDDLKSDLEKYVRATELPVLEFDDNGGFKEANI